MKNKKLQFISAVRILAPGDTFILNLAERVRDADLPPFPGAAALEFVAALSRLHHASHEPRSRRMVRTLSTASPSSWRQRAGRRNCSAASRKTKPTHPSLAIQVSPVLN